MGSATLIPVEEYLRSSYSPDREFPDVTVLKLPQPEEAIVTSPPHLCIEILSKDDTVRYMQTKD